MLNRPLSDQHVRRLSNQMLTGKWRYNGDTIKISNDGGILDGQHRLWAVVESKQPIETAIVRGIDREAFSTIDTLRKPRSGADVLALSGATRNRNHMSSALQWLLRWRRGILETYKAPVNRVENSDIEMLYAENPGIERALDRVKHLRGLANPAVVGFFYYILTNRSPELAEQMVSILENPAGVSMHHPFFRLRMYFASDHLRRKDPVISIALMVKAANAAYHNQEIKSLLWRNQGTSPEKFPKLEIASPGTAI